MDSSFAEEVNQVLKDDYQVERGVKVSEIKKAIDLGLVQMDEWHHTSMYGNKTGYYSADNLAEFFSRPEYRKEMAEAEKKREYAKKEWDLMSNLYDAQEKGDDVAAQKYKKELEDLRNEMEARRREKLGLENLDEESERYRIRSEASPKNTRKEYKLS